jgi:hypothetical protein
MELYQSLQPYQDPVMGLVLLLYSFDRSPVAPNAPDLQLLLAQALRYDTVQATASARLIAHNALTIGGVSVGLGAVTVCFWRGSGISVILEAGGRFTRFVQTKISPFRLTYMASSLVITSYHH